jgi:copper chaperone CopZ
MDVRTVDLKIEGMSCSSCVATLERSLNSIPGVSATINFATESAHATLPENVEVENLISAIEGSGYRASILSLSGNELLAAPNIGWRLTLAIIFAVPTIVIAMVVENAGFGAQYAAPIARKALDFYIEGKWPKEIPEWKRAP